MKKHVVFVLPKAYSELEEAVLWYEFQQKNLGEKLLECFDNAIKVLEENPEIFARKHKNFRELLISVFPYAIIYRVENNNVYVTSFFHTKRNIKKKYKD